MREGESGWVGEGVSERESTNEWVGERGSGWMSE